MPLEISKVVELYERCGLILKTKADLYLCFSIFGEIPKFHQNHSTDNALSILTKFFDKFINYWLDQMLLYQSYHPFHFGSSNAFFTKLNLFKNKTDLLSKQEQLIAELNETIEGFKNSKDPVAFYTLRKRDQLKKTVMEKMSEIKNFSAKNSETQRPMYQHKFLKQMKESFFDVYQKELEADESAQERMTSVGEKVGFQCNKIKQYLRDHAKPLTLSLYKNQFLQQNYEIIGSKKGVLQKKVTSYFYNINKVIKKYFQFWQSFRENMQHCIRALQVYKLTLQKVKENSSTIIDQFYKVLEDLPTEIWELFRIKRIFSIIKILDKQLLIIQIIERLVGKLNKERDLLLKMEHDTRQYTVNLSKNLSQRQKNFHIFVLDDKKYLEEQCKMEKYFDQSLTQCFYEFFVSCLSILKEVNNLIVKENIQAFEFHEVSSMLSKILIQDEDQTIISSRISKQRANMKNSRNTNSNEKKEKIKNFQNFLDSIVMFDDSCISQNLQHHSCALGPRLLLHGVLYPLQKGIYFQSVFNKKNLFFGKTKLFIPKEDIVQINETNALVIFPDIVEVSTPHGIINFHALGTRKEIFDSLTTHYFPQNIRSDRSDFSDGDFNECNVQFNEGQYEELLKPLDMPLFVKTFNNCKLNKFFKRYLSDDEFEVKGKIYPNFKNFYVQNIDGIDPKSTTITPEPPEYFCYKNEKKIQAQIPKTSERIHTYGKNLPGIPFIAKGGECLTEDKQVFYWISPKVLVILNYVVMKGYSLLEGMVVQTKFIYEEINENLRLSVTANVIFSTNSSTNSLLKGPTFSNLKISLEKMCDIIQKYEKGKSVRKTKGPKHQSHVEDESLKERIDDLEKENVFLKNKMKSMVGFFIIVYILSMILVWKLACN